MRRNTSPAVHRPVLNVVEYNPYAPQPFVMSEVAVCLRDAIRAAGYVSAHLVNRVDPRGFSLVLNMFPDRQAALPGLDPSRCAIFNLEQLGSDSALAGPDYRAWLANWLVVDYHARNVEWLRRENGPRQDVLELPIVPSRSLVTPSHGAPSVDVLFYGSMNERRRAVLDRIEALGFSTEVVAGAYAYELAPALHRARLVLHVHFYEQGLFPIARVLQPAALGVPVVCENSVFSPLNDWSRSGIVFAALEDLPAACAELLRDPAERVRRGAELRAFGSTIDFFAPLQAVLQALERRATAPQHDGDATVPDEEIEALLAQEATSAPQDGEAPAPLEVVRREPGQGKFGAWAVWVLLAFMLLGSINLVMSYRH